VKYDANVVEKMFAFKDEKENKKSIKRESYDVSNEEQKEDEYDLALMTFPPVFFTSPFPMYFVKMQEPTAHFHFLKKMFVARIDLIICALSIDYFGQIQSRHTTSYVKLFVILLLLQFRVCKPHKNKLDILSRKLNKNLFFMLFIISKQNVPKMRRNIFKSIYTISCSSNRQNVCIRRMIIKFFL
jgi:hypothetical protein